MGNEDNRPEMPPGEPESSPARREVQRWWAIWDYARQIQAETGEVGTLTDWESGWEFSNHIAASTSPQLLASTLDDIRAICDLLATMEQMAEDITGAVPGTPPETAGKLLVWAAMLGEALGRRLPGEDLDVRDVLPKVDPALEKRLTEMQAVINYWAGFASARSQQIAEIHDRLASQAALIDELRSQAAGQAEKLLLKCAHVEGCPPSVADLVSDVDRTIADALAELHARTAAP